MQPSRAPIIPSNGRAGDMRHATRATRLIFKKKEEKNSMTNDLFVENSSSSSSSCSFSVYSPLEPRRKILFFSFCDCYQFCLASFSALISTRGDYPRFRRILSLCRSRRTSHVFAVRDRDGRKRELFFLELGKTMRE